MNLNPIRRARVDARGLLRCALGAVVICAIAVHPAPAKTTNWTGATNMLWTEPANWDNGVPVSGDTANILGTSGSEFDVDLNGSQDISNIALTTTFTNFAGGTLDQNKNTAAAFTATDTDFDASAEFTDPGNLNWTRVTRPDRDANWQPGNGAQIFLNNVSNGSGGFYQINNMNSSLGVGHDITSNASQISNFSYRNNPNAGDTGSLVLENGSLWQTSSSWITGEGTGVFTLSIDNSTLQFGSNTAAPQFAANTVLEADNATINLPLNSAKYFDVRLTDPANWDGVGLTVSMTGISNAVGEIEVLSRDVGPFEDGFTILDGNFSFDRLELGNRFNSIFLRDDHDNSTDNLLPEAIYVRELVVADRIGDSGGEGLDLRGRNIYYETLIGDLSEWNVFDSVGGGEILQVGPRPIPEPSSGLLLMLGSLALMKSSSARTKRADEQAEKSNSKENLLSWQKFRRAGRCRGNG